jgi:hypothetical protein
MTTIHKIIGPVWRLKGERFETVDIKSARRKLAAVKATVDPEARIVSMPVQR